VFQNSGRGCDYETLKEKLNCSQQTITTHRPSGSSLLNINGFCWILPISSANWLHFI